MLYPDVSRINARINPRKKAVICGNREATFEQENIRSNQIANALIGLGVKEHDRVGVLSDNCFEYFELPYGVIKARGIIVPLNYRLGVPELEHIIKDSGMCALVYNKKYRETVRALKERVQDSVRWFLCFGEGDAPSGHYEYESFLAEASQNDPLVNGAENDTIYLQYTSGTTGMPKGVALNHRNFLTSGWNHICVVGFEKSDNYMAVMPYYHAVNVCHFAAGYRGCTTVIVNFEPEEILRTIERHKISLCMLVPTMIKMVLDNPGFGKYDLSSLRTVMYAASPMPRELLERALEVNGSIFQQNYGLTESSTLCTSLLKGDHEIFDEKGNENKRLVSIGQPIPSVEVRVVREDGTEVEPGTEVGEIIVKGDTVTSGYWKKPEESGNVLRNGWLYTGDMARRDEEYYIYLVNRKSDMIISGGVNIYPAEIEKVLLTHASVDDVAVFGVSDEKWIEAAVAYVVPRKGADIQEEDLRNFLGQFIGKFKIPKIIKLVSELPRDGTGKLDRKRMKREFR